jgi:hypothetical protein
MEAAAFSFTEPAKFMPSTLRNRDFSTMALRSTKRSSVLYCWGAEMMVMATSSVSLSSSR